MSTANELLRRALKDLEEGLRPIRKVELIDEIRAFLAAEPEAEPSAWQSLTDEEISDVLNVDPQWFMDGLNWKALNLLEYARDIEQALGEKNAKPFRLASWQGLNEIELRECYGNPETLNTKTLIDYGNAIEKMLKERNHPPSPARKPMTEREIMEQAKVDGFNAIDTAVFAIGVRWAERMHGIGGDD